MSLRFVLAIMSAFGFAACEATNQPGPAGVSSLGPTSATPATPSQDRIPGKNFLGQDISGKKVPAAMAARLTGERIDAFYGFVVLDGVKTINALFWNDKSNSNCFSAMARQPSGTYRGEIQCSRDGAVIVKGPLSFRGENTKRNSGTLNGVLEFTDGDTAQFRVQWDDKKFPDIASVAARLIKSDQARRNSKPARLSPQQIAFEKAEG